MFSDERKLISRFSGIFLLFFENNRNYSHPFRQTSRRKIIKSSSKIVNFIFFYENREFGGSFGNFLEKISRISRKLVKSSSKIAFFVFDIAIFHFLGDLFISLRDFLFRTFSKKTSKIAAFIVRGVKKNEWCEHKRATRKKRAFCDASQ